MTIAPKEAKEEVAVISKEYEQRLNQGIRDIEAHYDPKTDGINIITEKGSLLGNLQKFKDDFLGMTELPTLAETERQLLLEIAEDLPAIAAGKFKFPAARRNSDGCGAAKPRCIKS